MNYPQQDRGADDGLPCIAVAKQAQFGRIGKEAERREDDNQIGDVGDHRAQPVTPCGAEADQLAETFPGVSEYSAVQIRSDTGQQQHGERQQQNPDTGNAPANQ